MKMHLLLALLFLIPKSHATSFFIRPISEFTKSTSVIIRGVTSDIHSENTVNPNGEKTIYTFATLSIKEVIKGNISGSSVRIRKAGGTIDGVTLEIPSSVEFKEGEDGVFFLSEEQSDHSYEVTGMELGKFNLANQDGKEVLKGGLFAYSKPHAHGGHSDHIMANDLSENLKPWSINQLRELVKSQSSAAPEINTPTIKNNQEITTSSNLSVPNENANGMISSVPKTEENPKPSDSTEINKEEPLYIGSAVWYALAIAIMTLGVYLFLRRG